MRNMFSALLSLLLTCTIFAQKNNAATKEIKVPMEPGTWEYDSTAAQFTTLQDVKVVKPLNTKNGYNIFLKNQEFSSGTIEYDVQLTGIGFPGINFRVSPDKKNSENFYIRSFGPVTPDARTTLQYTSVLDGMNMWDITDEYQAGCSLNQTGWNHVRLVISGKQMRAYVNDMTRPALLVPEFEGVTSTGGISLSGNVIYANLVLKPNVTEGLDPQAGYISTYNDPRYLRNWLVGPTMDFPIGKEPVFAFPNTYVKTTNADLPDSTTHWEPLKADNRGILNLSRKFGSHVPAGRRLAWIKTTIQSSKAQSKTLRLGFSDEVWVFINGQFLYVDKNYFGTPQQKEPRGRCTIENTSINIPLQEGKNEIMIALANVFYGWAVVARFDDMDGIQAMR